MIIQLNPPIYLQTPKGKAIAHFLIDYGIDHDLFWVCFQTDTGECWTWKNSHIRADENISIGRHIGNDHIPKNKMEKSVKHRKQLHRNQFK